MHSLPTACAVLPPNGQLEAKPRSAPQVLVSVPVRNEAPRIAETIETLESVLDGSGYNWRLGIAEDGSTDKSKQLLQEISHKTPHLLLQTASSPMGRGWALRQMWSLEPADIYAFTDADLAAGAESILAVIKAVEEGADVAVGSRYIPGAAVRRPPLRNLVSRGYNWLVRQMFGDGIADHQCGLKAFSREAAEQIMPLTVEDSWFWDTEVLVDAVRAGLHVVEVPVIWTETKYTRTSWSRLLSDVRVHGTGLIRLNGRLNNHGMPPVGTPRVTPAGVVERASQDS